MTSILLDVEARIDGRETPSSRLKNARERFKRLAEVTAEDQAKTILAQMKGIAPDSEEVESLPKDQLEILKQAVRRISSGTDIEVIGVAVSAAVGAGAGFYSHHIVDLSPADIPVNGVLGLAGLVGGVLLDELPLAVRAAFATGGTMFLAGSTLYVRGKCSENS